MCMLKYISHGRCLQVLSLGDHLSHRMIAQSADDYVHKSIELARSGVELKQSINFAKSGLFGSSVLLDVVEEWHQFIVNV